MLFLPPFINKANIWSSFQVKTAVFELSSPDSLHRLYQKDVNIVTSPIGIRGPILKAFAIAV